MIDIYMQIPRASPIPLKQTVINNSSCKLLNLTDYVASIIGAI